jgi:cytosolic carboxypeptidase protein 5
VHCGETAASFFLQGIFDFLSSFNEQAKVMLQRFVFKIIPLLNPDGVARGYWRNDTQGLNLNRVYAEPDPRRHPTIYATKAAIMHEFNRGKLVIYTDLHAHCTKRGCFVFGNTLANQKAHIDQILLPKLMSLNCVNFGLPECGFNDDTNNKKDRRGDSRSSSGRATIFRETGLGDVLYCFTLEGNYSTGLRINTLQSRFDYIEGKKLLKEDSPIHDTSSAFYKVRKIPIYTAEIYQDVGSSFMISILDLFAINPSSRLIKSANERLADALNKLRADIKRDLSKPSIKSLKKKGVKKSSMSQQGPTFELVLGDEMPPQSKVSPQVEEKKLDAARCLSQSTNATSS